MLKLGNGWVLSERVLDDEIGGESNGQQLGWVRSNGAHYRTEAHY